MQTLNTIHHNGSVAWDGTVATARDIAGFVKFGFSAEIVADILVDAVFTFEAAPASAVDKCLPGVFTDVVAAVICTSPAVGVLATVTIPAGTKAGGSCAFTLPCKNGKFLRMKPVSGDTAKVNAVMVRSGPKR